MEIIKRKSGGLVELEIKGRLDGYWADHLAKALDDEIRQGSHHLLIDLSQVAFLSSAGIGILVKFYKQLKSIEGSLSVSRSSEQVKKILELSGLKEVLMTKAPPAAERLSREQSAQSPVAPKPPAAAKAIAQIEKAGALFDVYRLAPESRLRSRVMGKPAMLGGSTLHNRCYRHQVVRDTSFDIRNA